MWILFLVDLSIIGSNGKINDDRETTKNGQCEVISTENLISYGKENKFSNGIPKIIHYVYKTAYIPAQYTPHVQQCMQINNDVKFVFWTDFTSYRFMFENYPQYSDIYSSHFSKIADSLTISDIIRYFLLLKFGGIYMDLDTSCQKPFQSALLNYSCILSQEMQEQSRILWDVEYLAMNSLMMCQADHDFFKYLVGKLSKADNSWVVSKTGPILLTNSFKTYMKSLSESNKLDPKKSVSVVDAYIFSPKTEVFLESRCTGVRTGSWRNRGCKDLPQHRRLQKTKMKEAIAVHLFMHLGYKFAKDQIKILENICFKFKTFNLIWY